MVRDRTETQRLVDVAVLFGATHAVAAAQVRTRCAHDGVSVILYDHSERRRRLYVDPVGDKWRAEAFPAAAATTDTTGGAGIGGRGIGGLDDGCRDRLRLDVSVRPDRPSQSDCRRRLRFGDRYHRYVEKPSVRHQKRPGRRSHLRRQSVGSVG